MARTSFFKLSSVRKIVDDRCQLGFGLVIALGIQQQPDQLRSIVHFFWIDHLGAGQDAKQRFARNRAGGDPHVPIVRMLAGQPLHAGVDGRDFGDSLDDVDRPLETGDAHDAPAEIVERVILRIGPISPMRSRWAERLVA